MSGYGRSPAVNRALQVGVVILVVVAVAAIALYAGVLGAPTPAPSPTRTPTTTSPTIPPTIQPTIPSTPRPSATPIDTSIRASAVVVPQRSADLALSVGGIVSAILVREDDTATTSEVLLRLDQSTYRAAIDGAEAEVGFAQATLELAQLQLEQLPADASPGQIETAETELELAEAELELARSTLVEAETALRHTELRAPFPGTVADVLVDLGEQAVVGETLVVIGDLSNWLIETTDLSELEVVRVAVGDRATITFDALPDVEVTGRVARIQVRGTTENGGVLFAVSIRPDEHHEELRWNMSAAVRISPSD